MNNVVIVYWCERCAERFSIVVNVPERFSNADLDHHCPGFSKFSGGEDTKAGYSCVTCNHLTWVSLQNLGIKVGERKHECGVLCRVM